MKVLLQRVSRAEVRVEDESVGRIGHGLVAFIGVERGDDEYAADYLADKTAEVRVFADERGRMNRSVEQVGGAVLVVSQFTLAASTRRGRRPPRSRLYVADCRSDQKASANTSKCACGWAQAGHAAGASAPSWV